MILTDNQFEDDPIDFNENTAAERVGRRIRDIRTTEGLLQSELGKRIGLSSDRVQKYENGVRRPRKDVLKKFARALGVEAIALADPVVSNYLGVMYGFFEMEKLYDLKLKRIDGRLYLTFGDGMTGVMNDYLHEWEKECAQVELELNEAESEEARANVLEKYSMWKWTFPKAVTNRTKKELRERQKIKLQEQIDEFQKQITELDNEDE